MIRSAKRNKGITLIALVITIIVLLILAGVTIASLSGDNGILTRAAEAKERTRREDIQEQLNLWKTEKTMEENIDGNNINIKDFVTKLRDNKIITQEEFNEIEATDKLTIGKQEPIIFPNKELELGDIIPNGCTYKTLAGTTYNAGQKMPMSITDGDKFITTDYTYEYHATDNEGKAWLKGWNVNTVSDTSKSEYETLYSKINGEKVKSMHITFQNCTNLTKVPVIPDSIVTMFGTFDNCKKLTEAPIIPESVTHMYSTFIYCSNLIKAPIIPENIIMLNGTFICCSNLIEAPKIPEGVNDMVSTFAFCDSLIKAPTIPESVTDIGGMFGGCKSLTEAPIIPESVTNMNSTFFDCAALKGIVNINANNLTDIRGCFDGSAKDAEHKIVLKGTCPQLETLKSTGFNNGQFITVEP